MVSIGPLSFPVRAHCSKSSIYCVLMSGFGAPALTATPTPGAGEIDAAAHRLTLLDQIVDYFGIMRDQVRRRVGRDLLQQRRTGLEADDHLSSVARSKAGATSRTPDRMVSSAAPAAPGDHTLITPSATAATPLVLMASSTGKSRVTRFRLMRLNNGDANLRGR
jgi:hypothetical protein